MNKEYMLYSETLKKEIIHPGEVSRKPSERSICTITTTVIDGYNYNLSAYLSYSTCTVTLGSANEEIDKFIEFCLLTMTTQEESIFKISCPLWAISLRIRLDDVLLKPYIFQMSDEEKYSIAVNYKNEGVGLFKEEKIVQAFYKFSKALKFLLSTNYFYGTVSNETDTENDSLVNNFNESDFNEFRIAVYNNLASCQLRCKNYEYVQCLCTKSLQIEPNVKAFYRRALSFIDEREYEKAENDLRELLKLESNNRPAIDKLKLVLQLDQSNRDRYKSTVRKMFS